MLSAIMGSVVLVKIVEVTAQGILARMKARSRQKTVLDIALEARYVWRDHAYRLSMLLQEAGVVPPAPPDDPYTRNITGKDE